MMYARAKSYIFDIFYKKIYIPNTFQCFALFNMTTITPNSSLNQELNTKFVFNPQTKKIHISEGLGTKVGFGMRFFCTQAFFNCRDFNPKDRVFFISGFLSPNYRQNPLDSRFFRIFISRMGYPDRKLALVEK